MSFEQFTGGFDFIGDVHGCYRSLLALLETLDYKKRDGYFCYKGEKNPSRKVVFLGDIIDRGPQVREVLHCVHDMVEAGQAILIMGNHEFHAVAYHIPRPNKPGAFIREHTEHHRRLLAQTLDAFAQYPQEWDYFRQWLLQRPVFFEHQQFRAVHACWDQQLIDEYLQRFGDEPLTESFISRFYDQDERFYYNFLERLMRGIELDMPVGRFITGTDGKQRKKFRAKFWLDNPKTYGEVIFRPHMLPDDMHQCLINSTQKAQLIYYDAAQKPLFLGHYWQIGVPKPLTHNIACVDYSAVRGGQLTAYRFNGEQRLSASNFVAVPCNKSC